MVRPDKYSFVSTLFISFSHRITASHPIPVFVEGQITHESSFSVSLNFFKWSEKLYTLYNYNNFHFVFLWLKFFGDYMHGIHLGIWTPVWLFLPAGYLLGKYVAKELEVTGQWIFMWLANVPAVTRQYCKDWIRDVFRTCITIPLYGSLWWIH